jgi:hypothetical protein
MLPAESVLVVKSETAGDWSWLTRWSATRCWFGHLVSGQAVVEGEAEFDAVSYGAVCNQRTAFVEVLVSRQ